MWKLDNKIRKLIRIGRTCSLRCQSSTKKSTSIGKKYLRFCFLLPLLARFNCFCLLYLLLLVFFPMLVSFEHVLSNLNKFHQFLSIWCLFSNFCHGLLEFFIFFFVDFWKQINLCLTKIRWGYIFYACKFFDKTMVSFVFSS